MQRKLAVFCALLLAAAGARAADQPRTDAPPPAAIRWTKFVDPAEGAFSLDVPAGWRVTGGLRRVSAVESRSGVDIASSDGMIQIFYGDVGIPTYTLPSPLITEAGIDIGGTYSPGADRQFVVMPYRNGQTFADRWGAERMARGCGGVEHIGAQGRPDVGRGIDQAFAAHGIQTWIDAGEANFVCSLQSMPAVGYVFAATEMARTQIGALWGVKSLVGFVAARTRAAEAYALMERIVASFRIDPGWAARQHQTPAQTSAVTANQVVSNALAENRRTLQATSDLDVAGARAHVTNREIAGR